MPHSLRLTVLYVLVLIPLAGRVDAQDRVDRVRTTRGTRSGEVTNMTPVEVTISEGSGRSEAVPVNIIRSVVFDGEPSELTQARVNVSSGGFIVALDALGQLKPDSIDRDFVRQDVEFYRAYAAAQLALGGKGEIVTAGRQLSLFVRTYPQNYHYLEAVEAMGDLLVASGKYARAQKQYAELAKAPWPDTKLHAAVLIGRTLQAQEQHAEAIVEFDKVLQSAHDDDDARRQKLSAALGKAISLAETGAIDEAVAMLEAIIRDADPEETELYARAYNTLGSCYERAGKTKEALLAFLHVDVLCSTAADAHAEALAHLVPLWQAIGHDEQAREARRVLTERYPGSRWAESAP